MLTPKVHLMIALYRALFGLIPADNPAITVTTRQQDRRRLDAVEDHIDRLLMLDALYIYEADADDNNAYAALDHTLKHFQPTIRH